METSAIYGLESQSRSLCPSPDPEKISFLVGTLSPKTTTQIHQLEYNEDNHRVSRKVYKPQIGEIWQIQEPLGIGVIVMHNVIGDSCSHMEASLLKLQDDDEPQVICSFDHENLVCFDAHPSRRSVATVGQEDLQVWDLESGPKVSQKIQIPPQKASLGKWNPQLSGNQFALIKGTSIDCIDLRTNQEAWTLNKAHNFQVRDIDFNPNKQYVVGTCGDDCLVKFWDLRKKEQCIKSLEGHSHWVWRLKYNPFHDQLVLTSSSDSRVLLHSLPSLSSEPKGHPVFSDSEEDLERELPQDKVLSKYEEHEDAVYAVDWSTTDPWTFVSLSYDGRVVISRVPKSEKYRILL